MPRGSSDASRAAENDGGNPTFLSQLQEEQANHMSAGIAPTEPKGTRALTRRSSVQSVVSRRSSIGSMKRERFSVSKGVLSEEDIKRAFEFFDTKGKGRVSLKDLRDGIHGLQPWEKPLTKSEVLFLTKGQPFLTLEMFEELLSTSQSVQQQGLNPLLEGFKILDHDGNGHISLYTLCEVLEKSGYGPLDVDDRKLLLELVDQDRDGKITLVDFCAIGSVPEEEGEESEEAQR